VKLRVAAARPLLPVPLSILLTLLWVGLVRLFFLWVTVQAGGTHDGRTWAALLFDQRVLGRGRLPTMIVAISFLLLIYLWLDYRAQPAHGWRSVVFLLAAALLVYLGWAVWHAWWSRLDELGRGAGVLMTAVPGGGLAVA
jgi:hypothetical protein